MSGYVRIHRSLFEEHPAFRNDAEAMAFAWLIVKAQWKPTKVRYKDRILVLQRGQAAISVRDLARAMDRNKAWVERLLKRLVSEAMLTTRHETGVNVVTICNYDLYQADIGARETMGETPRETEARQGRDTEQGSEKEKKEIISPRKRGDGAKSLIPADWKAPPVSELPPRSRACAEQWTEASYQTEAEAFACYWRSERKMKGDWRATWANRVVSRHDAVMRAQKFGNAPPVAKASTWAELSHEEKIARTKESIAFYSRINRPDDVAECRRRLEALEGKPDPKIASLVSGAVRSVRAA